MDDNEILNQINIEELYRRAIHLKPQKLASPENASPHRLKRTPNHNCHRGSGQCICVQMDCSV